MLYGDLQFFDIIIFAAIAAFIIYRLRSVLGKRTGFQKKTNSLHIVFTSSLIVTIIAGLITIFTYTPINTEYINIILITSLFVTIANIFLYKSVIIAPLSITSTFRYSIIIFGIIVSYFILKEVPNINMLIGGTIIIISGIFIIQREKEIGKIS